MSGIHQFVPVLHAGDAVGRHTLSLRDAIAARGLESRIYVGTPEPATMTESTPVRLNGILVGAVQGIKLSGSKNPQRAVEFTLTIQKKYMREIPEDSTAAVTAANLLGSKFIDITKGQSPTPVKPGAELRSLQTQQQ